MSELFGNTAQPRWLGPTELDKIYSDKGREDAAPFVNAFQSAFSSASKNKMEQDRVKEQRAYQEQQQQKALDQLKPVAESLKGVDSAEGMMRVVSEHPEWMMNPTTGPFIQTATKNWMQAEKIKADASRSESGTIAGKMALQNGSTFIKELAAIDDPEAQAAITNMSPGKNGLPSPEQWQALGLAKATALQKKENARTQAELDAAQRGDVATTTVTDKGITTKYAPPKAGTSSDSPYAAPPKVITVDGRDFLQWGKQLRDLSGAKTPDKIEIELATHRIKAIDTALAKEPNSEDLKKAQSEARAALNKVLMKAPVAKPSQLTPAAPTVKPTAAASKVARANELSQRHPEWTKDQVIRAVQDEFAPPPANED